MKKILLFATVAIMASCQNQPARVPAIDLTNLDPTAAPEVDFYQYATGGWQEKNPLKPEFSRYGSFDMLRENNEIRINELFSEMLDSKAAKGSVEQKIADLYRLGLDSTRLNAEGAAPIRPALDEIFAIADRRGLTEVIGKLHGSVANPFFGVGVQSDLMNSDMNALYISQSGLGMGTRDYYLDEENAAIREAYKEYRSRRSRLPSQSRLL